jgi:hypothetical protein
MGGPDHAAVETTDLSAELKRGLSYIRNEKQPKGPSSAYGNGQVEHPAFTVAVQQVLRFINNNGPVPIFV